LGADYRFGGTAKSTAGAAERQWSGRETFCPAGATVPATRQPAPTQQRDILR
jgi:hypothetical protein